MAEVISLQPPEPSRFSHSTLRSSASHTSFFESNSRYGPKRNSYSYTDLRAGSLSSSQSSSSHSTPSSSLSLDTKLDTSSEDDDDDDDEGGLSFPIYRAARSRLGGNKALQPPLNPMQSGHPPPSPVESIPPETPVSTPDPMPISEDDTAVRVEPTQHVDYLSHDWNEEDIWSSWRHIVEHRRVYGERSRLENASWRTWAKAQFKLKTVSPETLNWLKDCDVTWLYGPLQPASNRSYSQHASEPVSRLSKSNSFVNKKPILKKRSMSEAMLQKSLSASSLLKQAAASVQAQQQASSPTLERRRPRPIIRQTVSDFAPPPLSSRATSRDATDYFTSRSTSGLQTPDHGERKHIRFDDTVEQCIAVDCKEPDDDEEDYNSNPWAINNDDDSSDEGVVMMKRSRRRRKPLSRTSSKSSFTSEGKTIAMLPSTTLKYRTDSPDLTEQQPSHSLGFYRSNRLSPSPSQETLRPSKPSSNFLLTEEDEDEDDEEIDGSFSGVLETPRASTPTQNFHVSNRASPESVEPSESGGLRRTASGMFMPFDDEEDGPAPPGIIGRVVDTVNTARDIAHVIWNVGWRS